MSPMTRYYYPWYGDGDEPTGGEPIRRTDGDIKSEVVEKLRTNALTKQHRLRVAVKQGVVIVQGRVSTRLAKRAAGDDCWDTPGVCDVSNQLQVEDNADLAEPLTQFMTMPVVTIGREATAGDAAKLMTARAIGFLVVVDEGGGVAGVVTDRDLAVRALANDGGAATPIVEVWTKTVITASTTSTPSEIVSMITDRGVRRIPVVDAKGALQGVITLGDLARLLDPGSALARLMCAPPTH
jgi:CBS domain-containing protein